jgi:hypothetical protein
VFSDDALKSDPVRVRAVSTVPFHVRPWWQFRQIRAFPPVLVVKPLGKVTDATGLRLYGMCSCGSWQV